ncbi:MAG: catechol 1,2-dioxygenase [Candidatus Devosia phytovorans]|uniref:Catechol 1,2-dioxygenase n=1 Tax=Candidatus Devosia phytovorans TaxID=3121372 RepID=A0AAJ5VRU6_9HYPH|nr:VOC family protein [Devosia sp.]WEK03524.1 MAG: catechol 1,2-dioxygenase [Devosia sp.]
MIDASVQTNVKSKPILPLTTTLGPVHIAVTEKAKALAIWQDVVGLELIAENGNELSLGAGGKVLIVLETGATRPSVPRTIGLYHVAVHVPTRVALAEMAVRALQRNVRISPTDHLVSEAIYLWDLDGNGIEITFETPWRGTLGDPDKGETYAVTTEGKAHSGRDPIDLDGLLGELGESPVIPARMPEGTRIGHVHVHVNDLGIAMNFYRDVLGFAGFLLIHSFGMGDVGLDYMPHTLAFNIWSGPNAALPPAGAAGLRWFTVVLPDAATLESLGGRLASAGAPISGVEGGIETQDPFGNRIRIVLA